jgi:hypothetical protein
MLSASDAMHFKACALLLAFHRFAEKMLANLAMFSFTLVGSVQARMYASN